MPGKLSKKVIFDSFPTLSKVDPVTKCWNWNGASTVQGYGQTVYEGKSILAHRLSWIIHFGEIPKGEGFHGTCVLHKCDNPSCVNPDHLFLGSNQDNMDDMKRKGRQAWKKGEPRSNAKLKPEQEIEV